MRFCAKDTIPQLAIMISIIMFLCNRIILTEEFVSTLSMNIVINLTHGSGLSRSVQLIVVHAPLQLLQWASHSNLKAVTTSSLTATGASSRQTNRSWHTVAARPSLNAERTRLLMPRAAGVWSLYCRELFKAQHNVQSPLQSFIVPMCAI